MKNNLKYFNVCILLISLVAFWNTNNALLPLLVASIALLILFYFFVDKLNLKLKVSDFVLLIIVLYEITSYYVSIYKPNSYYYSLKIFFFVILYYNILFLHKNNNKIIVLTITAYILIISSVILFLFIKHYQKLTINSLENLEQYRVLFSPFHIVHNEWITNQIVMLSFPMILYFQRISFQSEYKTSLNKYSSLLQKIMISRLYLILLVVTINIILFNILVLFSRGGYITIISVLVASITLLIFYSNIKPLSNLIKYFFFIIILPLVTLLPLKKSIFFATNLTENLSHERSIEGRIYLWTSAYEIFKNRPVFGIGSNNFPLILNSAQNKNEDFTFTGRISNSYLQILIEKGIVGFAIYISIFVFMTISGFRRLHRNQLTNENKIFLICFLSCLSGIIFSEITFSSVFFSNIICLLFCVLVAMFNDIIFVEDFFVFKLNKKVFVIILLSGLLYLSYYSFQNINTNINYNRFLNHFRKGDMPVAIKNINSVLKVENTNTQYLSSKALTLSIINNVLWDSKLINMVSPYSNIQRPIDLYKTCIKLSPNDDMYYHNLGWLYFVQDKSDSALLLFNLAQKIEPTIYLHYISIGLDYEYRKNIDKAFSEYSIALRISPDLTDSKFWKALKIRYPKQTDSILKIAITQLEKATQNKNPIYLSRLAKLYISFNNFEKAKAILLCVTHNLPNLSRPWYYLGYIYELNNDSIKMTQCYKTSILLDNNFYQPYFHLARYYDRTCKKEEALENYLYSMICWRNLSSEHSQRSNRMYFKTGINDDILPYGLLRYTKPDIDYELMEKRIVELQQNDLKKI